MPDKHVTNGEILKVSGKHWPAAASVKIQECNPNVLTGDPNACDQNHVVFVAAGKSGAVPRTNFTFATGSIGDGSCNVGGSCFIQMSFGQVKADRHTEV